MAFVSLLFVIHRKTFLRSNIVEIWKNNPSQPNFLSSLSSLTILCSENLLSSISTRTGSRRLSRPASQIEVILSRMSRQTSRTVESMLILPGMSRPKIERQAIFKVQGNCQGRPGQYICQTEVLRVLLSKCPGQQAKQKVGFIVQVVQANRSNRGIKSNNVQVVQVNKSNRGI